MELPRTGAVSWAPLGRGFYRSSSGTVPHPTGTVPHPTAYGQMSQLGYGALALPV